MVVALLYSSERFVNPKSASLIAAFEVLKLCSKSLDCQGCRVRCRECCVGLRSGKLEDLQIAIAGKGPDVIGAVDIALVPTEETSGCTDAIRLSRI